MDLIDVPHHLLYFESFFGIESQNHQSQFQKPKNGINSESNILTISKYVLLLHSANIILIIVTLIAVNNVFLINNSDFELVIQLSMLFQNLLTRYVIHLIIKIIFQEFSMTYLKLLMLQIVLFYLKSQSVMQYKRQICLGFKVIYRTVSNTLSI